MISHTVAHVSKPSLMKTSPYCASPISAKTPRKLDSAISHGSCLQMLSCASWSFGLGLEWTALVGIVDSRGIAKEREAYAPAIHQDTHTMTVALEAL